jgi:hypothetical protein
MTPLRTTMLATTVAIAALGLVMSAAAANRPRLSCGAVIATSTTLTRDLINCPGDGLVIGADGITLNLNGHTVSGDGPTDDSLDVGVRVEGHRHVTVSGGTVTGFKRGVMFAAGSDAGVVKRLRAVHNGTPNGGAGVRVSSSDDVVVADSTFVANHVGIAVAVDADRVLISGNTISDDTQLAMEVSFNHGTTITGNRMDHVGDGIALESADDATITGNIITDLSGPSGVGIQIYGNNNLVARNTVNDAIRFGIEVDDFQDPGHSPVVGAVLRDNTVHGGTEGIAIGPEAGGVVLDTVIEGNLVIGALDDGIQVVGPSTGLETTALSGNTAIHNGNLGIDAVPGVSDGGDNQAWANGNPVQCVNVSCSAMAIVTTRF